MSPLDGNYPLLQSERLQLFYWIEQMRTLPTLILILTLAAGVIFLLYGRPIFKAIVIINAALLAGWLGWQLGLAFNRPYLVAIGFALIFGLLAWPMFKLVIAILAGLVGAMLLAHAAMLFPRVSDLWPVFAIAGFILFAIAGWYLILVAITIFTALEGAVFIALSSLVLAERAGLSVQTINWLALERSDLVRLAILILAVLGMLYQFGWAERHPPNSNHTSASAPQ